MCGGGGRGVVGGLTPAHEQQPSPTTSQHRAPRGHATALLGSSCQASLPPPTPTTPSTHTHPCSDISSNNITGTIPATWAQLGSLEKIILQPGNPALCPDAPANATFKLCDVTDDVLCITPLSLDAPACNDNGGGTGGGGGGSNGGDSGSGGSSFPVAAVAVPVAVVAAAALAGGLLLWRRQKRRQQVQQQQDKTLEDGGYKQVGA